MLDGRRQTVYSYRQGETRQRGRRNANAVRASIAAAVGAAAPRPQPSLPAMTVRLCVGRRSRNYRTTPAVS